MTNGFVVLCPDIFIIKKLFYNIVQTWCLKMRDVIISPSLTLLLKVWVWYRCQNRIEKYPPWWKKLNKKDIPEKWDPGPIHDTRDSQPSTQDRTPGTISGSGTWNFKVGTGTRDPPPGTHQLGHGTRERICGTLFKKQIRGTKVRKPILLIRAQYFVLF